MTTLNKVIVVFKTHFDIGFTGLPSEVVASYGSRMLPDAVTTCEASRNKPEGRRFVWTMPSWPLRQSLAAASPETVQVAEALLRDGQIRWHALPFTTHTDFCGLEEVIRGFEESRLLTGQFGFEPIAAKMTDVPGHNRMLPSLLAKAGVRFLHLGSNPFSSTPDVPRLFRWRGPDGAEVITFYNKGQYGSSLVPPADWELPVWLAFMSTGDNQGPQSAADIERLLEEAETLLPGVEVLLGTMDDFYDAIKEWVNTLPIVEQELSDTWIHGVGSYPDVVGLVRRTRSLISAAEAALTMSERAGLLPPDAIEMLHGSAAECYRQLLLFGEHTWGLDIKKLGEHRVYSRNAFELARREDPVYGLAERSWEEKRAYARAAADYAESVRHGVMEALAANVGEPDTAIVCNTLGWSRSGWAEVTDGSGAGRRVWAHDVPAFGYCRVSLLPHESAAYAVANPEAATLENSRYLIQLDPETGSIFSLFDKKLNKEWVGDSAENRDEPPRFASYEYDVYGDADITEFIRSYAYRFYTWGVLDFGRANYPEQQRLTERTTGCRVDAELGQGFASLILSAEQVPHPDYGNARSVRLKVTLYDQPELGIDLELMLEGKQATPYVESGHILFPLRLQGGQLSVHSFGHVFMPESEVATGANHSIVCCDQWLDISNQECGMTIIPYDTPLASLHKKGILQYERQPAPAPGGDPVLYFNLFNNSWGTNFPHWMSGYYSFRYKLLPHAGDWREAGMERLALEAVTPLLAVEGQRSERNRLFERYEALSLTGGRIVAMKRRSDGKPGHVLRVQETAGRHGVIRLEWRSGAAPASCRRCDLQERPAEVMPIGADRTLTFHTKPFELHTFILD